MVHIFFSMFQKLMSKIILVEISYYSVETEIHLFQVLFDLIRMSFWSI